MTTLYFTPSAYQKAMFFLQKDVEVGAFCITDKDQPNLIIDYIVLKQESTSVSFEFDKDSLENYLNDMVDQDYSPSQCFRIFAHSHPGNSADPSGTDWTTFNQLMGSYPWFGMLIFAKDQSYFAYIKTTQGVGLEANCDIEIDWTQPCEEVDFNFLQKEFDDKVSKKQLNWSKPYNGWKPELKMPWDLEDRWKNPVHNYMNNKEKMADDYNVDEEDLDVMFEEYLDKGLHEMTDEEFVQFTKAQKELFAGEEE